MKNEFNDNIKNNKLITKMFSLSGIDESFLALRYRSNSCMIPSISDLAYCLDFVPKLKPKKHNGLPSPMNLNAKGFKHLKKNKVTKIMLETNNLYLSCPEQDDIDSDSTEGESKNLFDIYPKKDYEKKYSITKKQAEQPKYEKLGKRFSAESDSNNNNNTTNNGNNNDIPNLDLSKDHTSNNNININNIQFSFSRKKSRIMPEEIKINPKDLKGFAMEFESIYDQFERDLENFESQNINSNLNFVNFENIGSQENKYILSKKSQINPFSPMDKKNSILSNGNDLFRRGSSNNFARTSFDNDYVNLKNNSIENYENSKEDNNYFLKSRTNSILRTLENNVENKRNIEFSDK